jgi:hypothetical protein
MNHTFAPLILYGKSQEETPPENEQAQAPEALEIEPPQKAHVAKIKPTRRIPRRVFF